MKDLFEQWLDKENESKWIQRALIDNSYKNFYQNKEHKPYNGLVNEDLATYGDAVIKLCYLEIMLDNVEELTEEKSKFESDKYLVEYVAKHYNLLNYIHKDINDEKISNDYNYDLHESNNNSTKYIATAVEAVIGAIYKETKDLNPIIELLKEWIEFKK